MMRSTSSSSENPSSEKKIEVGITAASLPTREQIALRAYSLFEKSGCQTGQCLAHWLQAERELIGEAIALETSQTGNPFAEEESLSSAEVDEIVQNAPPRQATRPLSYAKSGA